MNELLLAAAGLIVLTVAIGLARILRGPDDVERLMAVQLLGTGGIAALLLIAYATNVPGVDDVALGLALLAAFATIAFVNLIDAEQGDLKRDRAPRSLQSRRNRRRRRSSFSRGRLACCAFRISLTRLHALAKADNLGLGLVVLGLIPRAESPLAALKLIVIWALVLLSGASTAQLIGRALRRGRK